MSADTRTRRFPEKTIRQVRLDCTRGLIRARFCPDRSEVLQLRCIDDRVESDDSFGSQLWYFEGVGVDGHDRRHSVYGVVEYSLQFGLHELVEDGVFQSEHQRERFRHQYERGSLQPTWNHPGHGWLLAGLGLVASVLVASLITRMLTA
ncbi:MAG: hypothetical protein WBD31_15950 [Rubripirellula sp.]